MAELSATQQLLILTVAFATSCVGTPPTNLSFMGSEFYLGFTRNFIGSNNRTLTIYTLKTTSVQFSITSLAGFNYTSATTAGNPVTVNIPASHDVLGYSYPFRNLGLHITSLETEPIYVVAWSYRPYHASMSYLGLPCHEQPTKNYTYYGVSTLGYSNFIGQILLVACKNNTNITVTPTQNISLPINPQSSISAVKTVFAGTSHKFVLHAGQTQLLYQAYVDLSGTKIVADNPLSVISGHSLGWVPYGYVDADPLITQVTPTITWGKTFLLSPHIGRINGQFYKIIAQNNDTIIQRKCGNQNSVNTSLSEGEVYRFNTTSGTYCSIISNEPIYIAQIGASTLYNNGYNGDPTLNTVPPIDQYVHSTQFKTFSPALSYYSILVPNDQYFNQGLIYDGTAYNYTWVTIYYPNGSIAGYGYSASASGIHTVEHVHSKGKLFISIYGWTTYGGYAYSGGMGLNPINPDPPLAEISFTSELYSVIEGNDEVLIYLNRSVNYKKSVSVRMRVYPIPVDTAIAGQDFTSVTKVVTFESGTMEKSVSIPILEDDLVEQTEYFTLRIEAIGDVLVFPITESVVAIQDNDYIKIGFNIPTLSLESTNELSLDVQQSSGILQSGEIVYVLLEVETLTGNTFSISRLDFRHYSRGYVARINLTAISLSLNFNINGPIINGRLVLDSALVNVTLEPSIVTVNYTQVISPSQNTYEVFPTSTYTCLPSSQPAIISTEYISVKASTTTITIINTTTTTITIKPTQTNCLLSATVTVTSSTNRILIEHSCPSSTTSLFPKSTATNDDSLTNIIPGPLITKTSTTSIINQYTTQTTDFTVNFNIRTTSEVLLYPSGCPSNLTIGSTVYIGGSMSAFIVFILLVVTMFCCYTYGKRNGKRNGHNGKHNGCYTITNGIASENPMYQFNPYERSIRAPWHGQNVQQNQDSYLGVYKSNQREDPLQYDDLKCPRIPLPPLPSKDQDNTIPPMSEKDEIYDDLDIQEMYVEMKTPNQ